MAHLRPRSRLNFTILMIELFDASVDVGDCTLQEQLAPLGPGIHSRVTSKIQTHPTIVVLPKSKYICYRGLLLSLGIGFFCTRHVRTISPSKHTQACVIICVAHAFPSRVCFGTITAVYTVVMSSFFHRTISNVAIMSENVDYTSFEGKYRCISITRSFISRNPL